MKSLLQKFFLFLPERLRYSAVGLIVFMTVFVMLNSLRGKVAVLMIAHHFKAENHFDRVIQLSDRSTGSAIGYEHAKSINLARPIEADSQHLCLGM